MCGLLALGPLRRLAGSGPSGGASGLAAYIVHPMKPRLSAAAPSRSKTSLVLSCHCELPSPDPSWWKSHCLSISPCPSQHGDNQISHLHSTKSSSYNLTATASSCMNEASYGSVFSLPLGFTKITVPVWRLGNEVTRAETLDCVPDTNFSCKELKWNSDLPTPVCCGSRHYAMRFKNATHSMGTSDLQWWWLFT